MKALSLTLGSAALLSLPVLWLTSAAAPATPAAPATAVATTGGLVEGAKAGTYAIDTVHSYIGFQVKHMGVSWAYGRFNDFKGEVVLNDDPSKCSVNIEVEAKSIDTANADRDKHLRAPDFFDVVQHPLLGFESVEVAKAGADAYKVTGNLTMHGVTKEVELEMKLVGAADLGQRMGYRAGFVGEVTIDRTDFGMLTYAKEGGIGKDVKLQLSFELTAN